ncbi:hypothetical protein LCGC14_1618710 [marine sediment metagenome]|uniref:Uncharacterized protein n=2 Tax=root TaxID=1 RepID=A0A831VTW3_9FLAO|nr:hypothetical protein [Pricia antarctica]
MRRAILIFSIITMTTLSSCNEEQDANAMLDNPVKRIHIYESITGNHDLMNEFLLKMQENDHAIQMMRGNQKIMGNLIQDNGMKMMMKDSIMMKNMMRSMVKDGKMMGNMMQMMHEDGMMSDDCLESCKNMMDEKGMDMKGMGMMGDGNIKSTKDDHFGHH